MTVRALRTLTRWRRCWWRQEAVTVVANDVQRRRARRRGDIDIRELRGPRRLLVVKLFELVDELLWVSRVCAAYTQSKDL